MPTQRGSKLLMTLALALGATGSLVAPSPAQASSHVWINEIHYDNGGTDTGEAIEIAGVAGTDLSGWSLVLYNGDGGSAYNTRVLSGIIPDQPDASGFGTLSFSYPLNGIQNGSPDGIALVNGTTVVQFLSYEGSFTAVGGVADGVASTDIGVFEPSSSPVGDSLQLSGAGATYGEFNWIAADATFGQPNQGQSFAAGLVVADCGPGFETPEGTAASTTVSASDSDGVVTSITIDSRKSVV